MFPKRKVTTELELSPNEVSEICAHHKDELIPQLERIEKFRDINAVVRMVKCKEAKTVRVTGDQTVIGPNSTNDW